MSGWNLQNIRQKVRRVTGRLSSAELTDTKLDEYINNYYEYTLPAEVKLERIHTFYDWLTEPNQEYYGVPGGFVNFQPCVTCDNIPLLYYQDPCIFESQNPRTVSRLTPWTGDGVTVTFATTITGFPISPDSVVITDNTEYFEDTNQSYAASPVGITGSLGGTAVVNYSTGSITVTFNTAPANGQLIYLSYIVFAAGRPTAILLYNEQFRLFPTPDTVYKMRMKAYLKPGELTSAASLPLLQQWGPMIAYGAARDIHADYGEMESYAEVTALYKEQVMYALSRTENRLMNTRAQPQF